MISIKTNNFDRLKTLADRYPAISEKYVNQAIQNSILRVLAFEKSSADTPVHTGNLKNNWNTSFGRFSGILFSNALYAKGINSGTGPHNVSASALDLWARKKGLNPFAVAANIRKFGTKANPFWDRTLEGTKGQVQEEMSKAIKGITSEL